MRKIDDKTIEITEQPPEITRTVTIQYLKNRKRFLVDQINIFTAEKDKVIQQIEDAKLLGVE